MPEGPELHLASQFVNLVCKSRVFSGKVLKSAVSKPSEVDWDEENYTISAVSRGKEMKITLSSINQGEDKKTKTKSKSIDILFRFGMSGKFDFYDASELKKHAHLNFFTKTDPKMVLSFVDYRRFGKWEVDTDWSTDRGPCILFEYQKFRENVLQNLKESAFNRPICEALLNQKYFNGIGNYLRAEILYRSGIPPFVSARSVLEPLLDDQSQNGTGMKVKVKSENPDILQLCHILPTEVINLGATGYDPEGRDPDYSKFTEWLQCYYKPEMKNMADHNKRTIWFHGNPGPMVPKDIKVRAMKRHSKNKHAKETKKVKLEESETDVPEQKGRPKHSRKRGSTVITRGLLKEEECSDMKGKSRGKPKKLPAGGKKAKVNGKKKGKLENAVVTVKEEPVSHTNGVVSVKEEQGLQKSETSKRKVTRSVLIKEEKSERKDKEKRANSRAERALRRSNRS